MINDFKTSLFYYTKLLMLRRSRFQILMISYHFNKPSFMLCGSYLEIISRYMTSSAGLFFVGRRQLCWKDHLVFICNAVCMDGCTDVCNDLCNDVGFSSTLKATFSLMRTQWLIFVKVGMWVVGGTNTTHVVCRHRMRIFFLIPHLHICSDWLITKKSNI